MVLLTSGQISVGISSAIGKSSSERGYSLVVNILQVFTFSTILFLSGYVLQQKTVRDIKAILHPPLSLEQASLAELENALPIKNIEWDEVAHVQVLQRHEEACDAITVFAELARQQSPAKRIMIYPQEWEQETELKKEDVQLRKRSMSVLRGASAAYSVLLHAANAEHTAASRNSRPHPLATISCLQGYNALSYVLPKGVVGNASTLDRVFGLSGRYPLTHLVGPTAGADDPLAFMISPSTKLCHQAKKDLFLSMTSKQVANALGSEPSTTGAFLATSSLKSFDMRSDDPRSKRFFNLAGYIKFTDSGIPRPEFDVPRQAWIRARPAMDGPREKWEGTYERYRKLRAGVCKAAIEP